MPGLGGGGGGGGGFLLPPVAFPRLYNLAFFLRAFRFANREGAARLVGVVAGEEEGVGCAGAVVIDTVMSLGVRAGGACSLPPLVRTSIGAWGPSRSLG